MVAHSGRRSKTRPCGLPSDRGPGRDQHGERTYTLKQPGKNLPIAPANGDQEASELSATIACALLSSRPKEDRKHDDRGSDSRAHGVPSIRRRGGRSPLTVVLAIGLAQGWRSSLIGAGTATVALTAVIAAFRPALSLMPIDTLRVTAGTLLLIFGLQWLRKAILRAGRYRAHRDEEALYRAELADAQAAGATSRTGTDWYALTLAFKGVFLEGSVGRNSAAPLGSTAT